METLHISRSKVFVVISSAIIVVWLVILPAVAQWPVVAEHGQWLDEMGIDPAAKLYSDHPVWLEFNAKRQSSTNPEIRKVQSSIPSPNTPSP